MPSPVLPDSASSTGRPHAELASSQREAVATAAEVAAVDMTEIAGAGAASAATNAMTGGTSGGGGGIACTVPAPSGTRGP